MAIVVQYAVTGMSSAKYDEVLARLAAAGAGAPAGRLYHVSFGSPDSLQVIDLFESPEALEAFGRTLVPLLGELGVQAVPSVAPAYRLIPG